MRTCMLAFTSVNTRRNKIAECEAHLAGSPPFPSFLPRSPRSSPSCPFLSLVRVRFFSSARTACCRPDRSRRQWWTPLRFASLSPTRRDTRWRPTTTTTTTRTTYDGRVGGTGMRYQGNQIVCARRIHVGRTNDGPLAVRSEMRRSRRRRGKAGGISRASPSDVLFSTRILKNANASFSLPYPLDGSSSTRDSIHFPLSEIFVEQHVCRAELLLRFLRGTARSDMHLIKLNVDEWKFVSLRNCMCDVREIYRPRDDVFLVEGARFFLCWAIMNWIKW